MANILNSFSSIFSDIKALKERYGKNKITYAAICEAAVLNKDFLTLLICSCLIATFGLFQNSAAVIIGAMIIAPLLNPILGIALGSIWGDTKLLWRSLLTLFVGSLIVLTISSFLAYVTPGIEINEQIQSRINPNLFDIFIALASGVVGAYAYSSPKIAGSISGVAISVALLPPLCTTGIALGLGNAKAALGAFLLFSTNLICISLASSIVFWQQEIYPIISSHAEVSVRAKFKLFLSFILLISIAVPLGFYMKDAYYLKTREDKVKLYLESNLKQMQIIQLEIKKHPKNYWVKCLAVTSEKIDPKKKAELISKISSSFDRHTDVYLTLIPSL